MDRVLNWIKEGLARLVVGLICFGYWKSRRPLRRPFERKEHYYIMRAFRLLFRTYYVWIDYPNPLESTKRLYLKVNLCENGQQWPFRLRGRYDLSEIRHIAAAMEQAEEFIDVGANIGLYAITIAQAFPKKRVVAFEPLRSNFESLQASIERNDLDNCEARCEAISDAAASRRFYVNPIHDGGGSLLAPSVYKTGDVEFDADAYQQKHPEFQPWVDVATVPLDHIVRKKSVVKIDVEGAELEVLRSGHGALRAGLADLVIVEAQHETIDEIIELMAGFAFDSFTLPDLQPAPVGTKLDWFVANIVCLRKGSPANALRVRSRP